MTELQPCPKVPSHLVATWDREVPYTIKVWKNGRLIDTIKKPNLTEALHWGRAIVRLSNTHRSTRFLWTVLGSELKLGSEWWQENDVVIYITAS
ncbi:hypothetical protein GMA7_82 [Gordonia phage GMA7]|uniref:Uncharacterized protein n=1 Tax=Gordonia phage GMA7 TaxID=1647286 RepID=A0A0K0N6G1_9CAUD|nr:hypothetical protein AU104_gp036 [Gordonia phage GMA7]AKJ72519.1 hypothetical protein GMA7_82 [Gordonia phage GMA7]